jgi:hypothetical protein
LAAAAVSVAMLGLLSAQAVLANLPGSTFESTDGNKPVNTTGNIDWNAGMPNLSTQDDLASGSDDNAFGQGAKEDIANPSVVFGSIPPNKSDLSKLYVAFENPSADDYFLYLAWERTNVLGSANMDFEFNQSSTIDENGVTPVRTAGDILVTFDFTNGGGTPVLGLLRWVTTGNKSQCYATNGVPCWGNRVDLSAAGFADGAVAASLTFGEAAINLGPGPDGAGVFSSSTCSSFGSAFLKSRSAASFPAELKDFIAPEPVSITNCGSLLVKKTSTTDTTALLSGAVFTVVKGVVTGSTEAASSTVPETATAGYYCLNNLKLGSHTVTETTAPNGYNLTNPASQTVNVTSTQTCAARLAATTITPDATFANPPALGAIKVTKTQQNKSLTGGTGPLQGATFQIWQESNSTAGLQVAGATPDTKIGSDGVTDATGVTCFGSLPLGTYYVHESAAPTGYALAATQTAAVTTSGTCDAGFVPKTFVDVPLSKIQVVFTSLAGLGVTVASISCTSGGQAVAPVSENNTADPALDDADETITNLVPGTYTCTVVVDP